LGVPNLLFTGSSTIAIQMALKALNISKSNHNAISYVYPPPTGILWEGCTPVFVDIDPQTFV
jgi:dTDP-4-amino-4,6-dideoxygalactose transaminase